MHSTLVKLSLYDDAHALKQRMIDEYLYMMGCYNFRALDTAFHNFSLGFDTKHNHEPKGYLEKPFMHKEDIKKPLEEMTDEELDEEIMKAIQMEQQYMNRSKLPPTKIAGLRW